MKTDEYHLNSLSKIKHKKWELFVVSRIVHGIWNSGIEYTCQQYVKTKSGDYFLADICFPSLGIWCEINEMGHVHKQKRFDDDLRKSEIMQVTNWECVDFNVFSSKDGKQRPLKLLVSEVDDFVTEIKQRFSKLLSEGKVDPWMPGDRYLPDKYINQQCIKVGDNVAFRYQRDALRLFGYDGGHFQKATWLTCDPNYMIWFPKLYPNKGWKNSINEDGTVIETQPVAQGLTKSRKPPPPGSRIVFARNKNRLGETVYRFTGVFDLQSIAGELEAYELVSNSVRLSLFR